ncbi:MAG: hypothetical protein H6752_13530 [Candidatus Omnitrophica bacterium]|nr:hypothetical protein [Candidatus Omnitrophota bacterium]
MSRPRINWLAFILLSHLHLPNCYAQTNPLTLEIDAPASISGSPGEVVQFEATVQLTRADVDVQGWSLSVGSDCHFLDATTQGTIGADVNDDPPGIRNTGFENTQLVDPNLNGQGEGTVSAVVLSFTMPIVLESGGGPYTSSR